MTDDDGLTPGQEQAAAEAAARDAAATEQRRLHSAAVHSDYVSQRAEEAYAGAVRHRDGLAARHQREQDAADQQIAEAGRAADVAAGERTQAYAALGLTPPEVPGTEAAAGAATAKGSAS